MDLIPLQRSAEYDDVESELKALFLNLYTTHLDAGMEEANTLGMPHLGPNTSISRGLNNDGLALMNNTPSDKIRLLFKAWRYLNPQRGTKFLAFYLRALFGNVFTIEQLWCKKDGTYPADAASETEIYQEGLQLSDYFLTSRLRVDIETDIVPERILQAARTAVAARFVLELRAARRTLSTFGIGIIGHSVVVCRTAGSALYLQPPVKGEAVTSAVSIAGGSMLTYSNSGNAQTHLL